MSKSQLIPALDLKEREHALDTKVSVLVQAPAGSGKTTILTDRYLKLLGEVDDPQHIVAITFTNAAAAEMRNRILDELRKPEPSPAAQRAINRSRVLGWRVLELPEQLRIATIDSFCRELALQQPMLSQLSGQLNIDPNPAPLYRNAARRTLAQIDTRGSELAAAVEILLLWRDNNWQELEDQLLAMLKQRDRWMHGFVLERDPDWEQLRKRLERPFRNEALKVSGDLHHSLNQVASLRDAALALARFACENPGNNSPMPLAGCMELRAPSMHEDFDSLLSQYRALTDFLLTSDGTWRSPKGINKNHGFPPIKGDKAKQRFGALISELRQVQGLQSTLSALQLLPPAHYSDEEWSILRACFMLLRHAAGELRVLFAENGVVDFIEVAQAATHVLARRDGTPSDAALAVADGIHHLLVDEFQDTSRKQHALLSRLISAWPEREGRTCFIVGDPMQSIYFFRDADTELFARIKSLGLETADGNSLPLEFVPLATNFRTDPALVAWSNDSFARIFGSDRDGEISFNEARAVRKSKDPARPRFSLHLKFIPDRRKGQTLKEEALRARETAYTQQIDEIVATIRGHQTHIETTRRARASGSSDKYRVAILARAKKSLVPIANTLRKAQIPFRALDAEGLREQQEVLDVLALAKAWLNPFDRVAWLGVLRAPWCGLKLDDLHVLISADDLHILERPVPVLMEERLFTLSSDGRNRVERILHAYARHQDVSISSLGTWREQT